MGMVDKWRVRNYHMFANREQEDIANKCLISDYYDLASGFLTLY